MHTTIYLVFKILERNVPINFIDFRKFIIFTVNIDVLFLHIKTDWPNLKTRHSLYT